MSEASTPESMLENIPESQRPIMNELLNLLTWSDSSPISISLVSALMEKPEEDLAPVLLKGVSAGLLEKEKKGDRYKLAITDIESLQKAYPIDGKKQWIIDITHRLGDWFEARRKQSGESPEFGNEIGHLRKWLANVLPHSSIDAARLTWFDAYPAFHAGKFSDSGKRVQEAIELLDKTPDAENFLKLKVDMLTDMGFIHSELREHQKSLDFLNQAIDLLNKKIDEQSNTENADENMQKELQAENANLYSNIGATYDSMGNGEEAVKHFEKALEIRKGLFGEEHADTATSLNNLGTSYYEAGQYRDAIEYLEKALEIRCRVIGEEDTDTADSLYNYAVCLIHLKKFKDAYERVNRFLKKISPSHPQYNELASLIPYIDRECLKSGFRPPSGVNANKGGGSKKKKKKKKKK